MDYFRAAEILKENWKEIVASGRYSKEELATLESVKDNPELHQRVDAALQALSAHLIVDKIRLEAEARGLFDAAKQKFWNFCRESDMYSIDVIRDIQKRAGKEAKREKLAPYHPESVEDLREGRAEIPFLGNYVPPGWVPVEDKLWFVDISGVGREGEPALTQQQFLREAALWFERHPTAGFALVEIGQFQGYVQAFERKASQPVRK